METLKLVAENIDDLPKIADEVISYAQEEKIWVFDGQMGAGKTTLIKSICNKLGVIDLVNSPTFSIVNEYGTETGDTYYHFDFYRLKDEWEALDIGIEEYLDSGNICLLEWASKIERFLPESYLLIAIEADSEQHRHITIQRIHDA